MPTTTLYTERKFLGKTAPFASKEEQRHEDKHLKAYLRGDIRFVDGYEKMLNDDGKMVNVRDSMGNLQPVWFEVKQELTVDQEKRNQFLKDKKKKHEQEQRKSIRNRRSS